MTERVGSCPNCGAEIRFRWSGAVQTTCPACRSILVRRDVNLERVGRVGDVPASMSRIQLGTTGRFKGKAFEVVGRIAYRYGRGHWSEWHLRMADGSSAWLSDAQGEYAVTRADPDWTPGKLVPRPGGVLRDPRGTQWTVASVTKAAYLGVEGELPFEYWDKTECLFVDLKSGTDRFATIDYSESKPLTFIGEYESFIELRLDNLRDADAAPAVQARALSCPQCGAAIELRTGSLAQGVACAACTAVLDVRDEGLAIVAAAQEAARRFRPVLPLGSVGRLKGIAWRVVGVQVRAITVEGFDYAWREYLLWNVDAGFRYITEYENHWNDVTVLRGVPTERQDRRLTVEYLGKRFKHFQRAHARTVFVLGEFPWEVRIGDVVAVDDFVAPPLMLSREVTDDEVTWSLGTYMEPVRIHDAFQLQEPLHEPRGVFANQPNPYLDRVRALTPVFVVLAIALAILFVGRRALAASESVFADSYAAGAVANPAAFTTRPFTVRGRSNVEISIHTDVSNSWAFFNLALLPTGGGRGYELGREVSYYYGVSGGESWTEGSPSDRAMLAAIPPGSYYLLVDIERDPSRRQLHYEIRVRRDVPRVWPFVVALIALALPVLVPMLQSFSFASKRWQESDYAWSTEE